MWQKKNETQAYQLFATFFPGISIIFAVLLKESEHFRLGTKKWQVIFKYFLIQFAPVNDKQYLL